MKKKVVMICLPLALLALLIVAGAAFAQPAARDGTGPAILAAQTASTIVVANYAPADVVPSNLPAIIAHRTEAPMAMASGVASTANQDRVASDLTAIRSEVKPLRTGKRVADLAALDSNSLVLNTDAYALNEKGYSIKVNTMLANFSEVTYEPKFSNMVLTATSLVSANGLSGKTGMEVRSVGLITAGGDTKTLLTNCQTKRERGSYATAEKVLFSVMALVSNGNNTEMTGHKWPIVAAG